ncbi:hypothetical protein ASU33_09400 [Solirubrum puertoriconensis]|uniref:Uncharacterized protein n=1 Tax=Solirubrum puertoriconensis TaxID=1751427 RepID=A0A9X0HLV5_SOLP1|nr:hypothetical protein ASU33_09400 [Solirubrum puertoriconensis]
MRSAHWLLLLPLLLDLGYSYVQHLNVPHDGDMVAHVLPRPWYTLILDDPLGLKVLLQNQYYSSPNRYFAFATLYQYMHNVPLWLQAFVDPIYSTYMACAIAKTIIQAALISLLAYYAGERVSLSAKVFLIAALLATPFFQTAGFHEEIGIIDRSITYTIFYALPLALLLVYFLPFYRRFFAQAQKQVSVIWHIILPAFAVVLALNGPLIPAVAGLMSGAMLLYLWQRNYSQRSNSSETFVIKAWSAIRNLPWGVTAQFCFLILVCAYSLYIGTHNSENITTYTLAQRYEKLWLGIPIMLGGSWAFPLLFFATLFNVAVVAFGFKDEKAKALRKTALWLLALAALYLALLPLGGYRDVRPYILRRDTIIPVTLCFIYLFSTTSIYLLSRFANGYKYAYIAALAALVWFYSATDRSNLRENNCEVAALQTIAQSKEKVVHLESDCSIMNWGTITDSKYSEEQGKMLHYWRITKEEKRFYH